jgi:hypothetical protein
LSIAGVATAQETLMSVIDDFESYWGTPALFPTFGGPWSEDPDPPSSSTLTIEYGDKTPQVLNDAWYVAGGWADPANPTNYDVFDQQTVASIDLVAAGESFVFTANTRIRMDLKSDTVPSNYYIIGWNTLELGYHQTWIPGPGGGWVGWGGWFDRVPAIASYFPPSMDGKPEWQADQMPNLEDGEWHSIEIGPGTTVTWFPELWDLTIQGITIEAWSNGAPDSSGASGDFKMDGTNVVWPVGPSSGNLRIDNIERWEVIPEPMTIGLLGLGGLALIRRKR